MSAKHAVLGLLLQRPAYPYELADRLQARLGPAWAINSGQLSQTVRALESEGLIGRVGGPGAGRGDRNVFAVTESGTQEFERWCAQDDQQDVRLVRRPLLIKLALAKPERLRDALDQVSAYEQRCLARINEITKERDEVSDDGIHVRADHVLLRVGLSGDIFQFEAELRWARHAHQAISWLLERDAVWPGRSGRAEDDEAATGDGVREELFGRMAARQTRTVAPAEET
jgi:PadR family transcriptional regulator, regulatory protein AphA